jgi:hypothetical protein
MRVVQNIIDSTVFGKTFLEIVEFTDLKNFKSFEQNYLHEFNPFYVSIKLPIENLNLIQELENHGFNFIEVQIREKLKIRKTFDHIPLFPYVLERVNDESDLAAVLAIAENTFRHDRYYVDPLLPKTFSGERYKYLVKKSFANNDESLYKFVNSQSGEILGFKTHKIISQNEALMYLGGIKEEYKRSPIPVISGYLELNHLFKQGINIITTHISGGNYGVLNLELKEFGYKVVQNFIILRKIYS